MYNKFLFFDVMITPKLITFIYWLMLLGAVGYGLSSMFSDYDGFTIGNMVKGLAFIVAGIVGSRVWCELMIVVFKINENLQELKNKKGTEI